MRTYIPMPHVVMVSKTVGRDAFGKPKTTPAAPLRCQVIKAVTSRSDTPLGVSSASAGHAEETLADFEMMVRPGREGLGISMHDVVRFADTTYSVVLVQPLFDVFGRIDHYIVRGDIEQKAK